jgi:hypothetical protein
MLWARRIFYRFREIDAEILPMSGLDRIRGGMGATAGKLPENKMDQELPTGAATVVRGGR